MYPNPTEIVWSWYPVDYCSVLRYGQLIFSVLPPNYNILSCLTLTKNKMVRYIQLVFWPKTIKRQQKNHPWPNPISQSVASSFADPGFVSLIPARPLTLMEIYHGIFSTVILLLRLIQEGLLSVTSKSFCTEYWVTVKGLPRKSVVRLTDQLNMTIAVDWDIKPQTNQTNKRTTFVDVQHL